MKKARSTNTILCRRQRVGFRPKMEKIEPETRSLLLEALNVWHVRNGFGNATHGFERHPEKRTAPVYVEEQQT